MRQDIQLLRGIAVLLVVIFHANLGIVNHGYLGVDVFFVISGFLITTIILNDLNTNTFSFGAFYLRRAKRLLPALYCTLAITALLSYWFISPSQWNDFIAQLVGALTFSSNIVLPTQVGYFESSAEGKPLLHIWSLSLEEQYYFFLPLVLFFTTKSLRLFVLIALAIGSLTWCLAWAPLSGELPPILWRLADASIAEWAFYLFPTRAWELLAGSICAWVMVYKPINIPHTFKYIALFTVLFVSCISIDTVHPRGNALVVVLATSLLLLGDSSWLVNNPFTRLIEKTGDWSYSIYLVHWPIFAFSFLGYAGQVPIIIKLTLVAISILLGYAQYKFVETPFRFGWHKKSSKTWRWLIASTVAVVTIPIPMAFGKIDESENNYAEIRELNYGLSNKCDTWIHETGINIECKTSDKPTIAIWGDSYAMHLVPGIAKTNKKIVQLTKSACGPILDVSPIYGKFGPDWARQCAMFNYAVFKYITNTDSITHVILSSPFHQYFKNDIDGKFLINKKITEKAPPEAINGLTFTINKIKDIGKTPILVSPPTKSGFDIGECLERLDSELIVFKKSCDIPYQAYIEHEKEVISALKDVAEKTNIKTIWLNKLLCHAGKCKSKINDTYVYRDDGHLSVSGSEALLGDSKIWQHALN